MSLFSSLFFLSFLKFFILSESTKLNAHLTGTKFPHAGLLFAMLGHILHSPGILSGVFYTLDSRTGGFVEQTQYSMDKTDCLALLTQLQIEMASPAQAVLTAQG